MIAKLITAAGKATPIEPKTGKRFSLEEARRLIGCKWIDIIEPPGKTGAVMIIDDEAKLNQRPINELASRMWRETAKPGSPRSFDPVAGDVILCHESQV